MELGLNCTSTILPVSKNFISIYKLYIKLYNIFKFILKL